MVPTMTVMLVGLTESGMDVVAITVASVELLFASVTVAM